MKEIYRLRNVLIFFVSLFFQFHGFTQQIVSLPLSTSIESNVTTTLNALIIISGEETFQKKADLTILGKYFLNENNEKVIQLRFSPKFRDKDDEMILFDKGGDFHEVMGKYEKSGQKTLMRDADFTKKYKSFDPFYKSENLNLSTPLVTGINKFSDKSVTFNFRIAEPKKNIATDQSDYELIISTYYANKDKIISRFESFIIKISLAETETESCDKFDQEFFNLIKQHDEITKLLSEKENMSGKSKEGFKAFIDRIKKAQRDLSLFDLLKDKISSETNEKPCQKHYEILTSTIDFYLKQNSTQQYEELIQKTYEIYFEK